MQQLPSSPLGQRALSSPDSERLYQMYPDLPRKASMGCPTCRKNRGEDENGVILWRGEEWECNCQDQLQRVKHYLNAGIGMTYQRLSWDDWKTNTVPVDKIRDNYLSHLPQMVSSGVGIVATGTNGTGKTMALTLMLKELVMQGYSCFMVTFADLIEMKKDGWRSEEEFEWFKKKVQLSQVLLIDDLGKEYVAGTQAFQNRYGANVFDSLLRTRVQGARPTFISTNMRVAPDENAKAQDIPDTLASFYGGSAISLIAEQSMVVTFNGQDFRPDKQRYIIEEIQRGETRPIF